MINDTIVALATPNMKSAISIIRISGPESIELVNGIFSRDLKKVASHTINYGYIIEGDKKLDEVLVSVFKAPKTYTCEDVVEINTHGGIAITRKILNIVLSKGARLANPGEFSQRAYLNGRIDMLEVEAINDMVEATNEKATQLAMSGLSKQTTKLINEFKESLLQIIAQIEVNIDYPEYDDVKELTNNEIKVSLIDFKSEIMEIINNSKTSNMIKNGVKIAIIGRPNAGKSSLLNAFLEQDKAIVTNIEGTTRDIVEADYMLNGINLIFLDTAGIRDTDDKVESIGIEKSLQASNEADLIILVLDSNTQLNDFERDLINKNDPRMLVVINKSDLNNKHEVDGIKISALNNDIEELKHAIVDKLDLDVDLNNEKLFLSNQRHLALLNQVDDAIDSAIMALNDNMPSDIIVSDLEQSYEYLQELLGQKYQDSLLDELFSRFCLGK
ncbi:tRNA modification GTPase [Bacilli bacterium PM5-9]|nr:tRNA modification GTPase [Bacilli bacterium PM5-9]